MQSGSQRGVHVPPSEGKTLWVVGGTYTFEGTDENTGGVLLLLEASVPPQSGPGPYINHREDGGLLHPSRTIRLEPRHLAAQHAMMSPLVRSRF